MATGSETTRGVGSGLVEWHIVDGKHLEACRIPARLASRPTIVMLHEGLGSVSHWKEFPELVAAETGSEVFVYSRYGHGNSSVLEEPRQVSYMHQEAEVVLPKLLEQAGIQRPVLLGHSDGASIALLYAAKFPDHPVALILEAPHVFVEDLAVRSIAQAKTAFETSDLAPKLARHHQDANRTFWGWNNIWLAPQFRSWNIESSLDSIRCPVLVIQGEDDEYGTLKQIEAIQAKVPAAKVALLPSCMHAPHRDQPEMTLRHIVDFLNPLPGGR